MKKLEIPKAVRDLFARVAALHLARGGLITTRERSFECGGQVAARDVPRVRLRRAEAIVRQAWRVAETLPAGVEAVTLWSAPHTSISVTRAGVLRWRLLEPACAMSGGYDLTTPADVAGRLADAALDGLAAAFETGRVWDEVRDCVEACLAARSSASAGAR